MMAVFTPVRQLVCLFVSEIIQKQMNGFPRNLEEGWDMGQDRNFKRNILFLCGCRSLQALVFFNIFIDFSEINS